MSPVHQNPSWAPSADIEALKARAELLHAIRVFFRERGVLEVETPVLSSAGNSDPGIAQFTTHDPVRWLRTSPEYAMKRLLASGSGDIFELGRVFRRGESGSHHNIEFTMLEWYRTGWDHHQLMDEVVELVRHCLPGTALRQSKVCYRDLFRSVVGVDPFEAGKHELLGMIRARGVEPPELSRQEMLDLALTHFVQPGLPEDGLTLVHDYPAGQAALARIRPEDPPVAERFELFLGRYELANGYRELTDPVEQEARFARENELRAQRGEDPVPVDRNLLAALEAGLPECSGVALGVDRLLMYRLGAASMKEVMAFTGRSA